MSEPRGLIAYKAQIQQQRMPAYRRIIQWTWRVVAVGLLAVTSLLLYINFTAIPSFRELEDPKAALATELLGDNGEILDRFFVENRVPVPYEEINPWLVKALIATEDERFMRHAGVDGRAVMRVVFRTILMRDQSAGGGSTITQQLAKNLYSDREFKGMTKVQKLFALMYRKLREWITAVKLERSYTKEEILAIYLNQFNFINDAYGIQSAAEVYFGKNQKDLLIQEAAMLVGMLKNPSYFNPTRFTERCFRRRWVVLAQMRKNNYLTQAQYDSLKVTPLDMSRFRRITYSDGKAPYLSDYVKKEVDALLDDPECRKPDGGRYNLYRDGLRIYTTIDPAYQAHAEAAMREHMTLLQKRFFEVWKNRDPWRYKGRDVKDEEIRQRLEKLDNMMRETDRYQNIRSRYFDEVSRKIQARYNLNLRDTDIERLLREEREPGYLAKLSARDPSLSVELVLAYRKMLNAGEWATVKTQWSALQREVKRQFNQKTRMKVFAWNAPGMEKDTVMTPFDSLRYHRMFLQTGIVAVDPETGAIKVWVGGINHKYFKFNHINTVGRQVGSTFKPFVYATAIAQQGISPCYEIYDNPVTIPARYQNFTNVVDWTPKNSTGSYSGARYTLKEALKKSVNTASAFLMKQMGDTRPVIGLCHNLGIDSTHRRIPHQPSICLGAADLTVLDMAGAYVAFANQGVYTKPYVISKIEDKNGRVIWRALPEERIALSPGANYVMVEMLRYNMQGAAGFAGLRSDIGGKTGTTNDYTDGWFMGITPRLVVGVWVGGDDRWIRFTSLTDGQGARMARPIFAGFVKRLENDKNSGYDANARFKRPEGDIGIETDCTAYRNAAGAGEPTSGGDEEDFNPDRFGDEPDRPTPPSPGSKFGDQQ